MNDLIYLFVRVNRFRHVVLCYLHPSILLLHQFQYIRHPYSSGCLAISITTIAPTRSLHILIMHIPHIKINIT
jgi:hypothetical protein